ncbi:hypothetical protein RhiJN_14695 [Ceratobasidium sp. AG-Ba]|nr:hypothetical protein RhiJN_14695 [Ceratobasidium sp. AG-Ba]QRW15234.1 hypothetical protein RhiLY_14233 [Ceratobasidium sp. AG-Ba]
MFQNHVPNLKSGTRIVETLSLYWPSDADVKSFDERASRFVELCPELRALEMRLPKKFADFTGWHVNNFDVVFAAWVQKTLAPLSQLTHLTLHISQPQEIRREMQQKAVEAISLSLPNLVHVILPVSQCEWSRMLEHDGFTCWTPRPNLGFLSIEWWLDFLELDGAAHVYYAGYVTQNGDINGHPHKYSEHLDQQSGRAAFCEDVTRVVEVMKKYWDESCVPTFKEIEDALFGRANRFFYVMQYDPYDYMDVPL